MKQPATKTDLIISMTLAEIFLLILFVVWYSQGAGAGPEWERIAKDRQKQINDLQTELQNHQEKLAQLEKLRKWWLENFGVNPPASITDLAALRPQGIILVSNGTKHSDSNARSSLTPKCSELGLKEVLFASVIRGRDSYDLNGETKTFADLLAAYATDLATARQRDCRYVVIVSYKQDVKTDDFVFSLQHLRSAFYVQLRSESKNEQ
jgi:hypothetical protein